MTQENSRSNIQNAERLARPTTFDQWLIATATITSEDVKKFLPEPHYTESDPTKTAGGLEDHWAFRLASGMCIGIVFRRPYAEISIFADPPDSKIALDLLDFLLVDRSVNVADPPLLFQ